MLVSFYYACSHNDNIYWLISYAFRRFMVLTMSQHVGTSPDMLDKKTDSSHFAPDHNLLFNLLYAYTSRIYQEEAMMLVSLNILHST